MTENEQKDTKYRGLRTIFLYISTKAHEKFDINQELHVLAKNKIK